MCRLSALKQLALRTYTVADIYAVYVRNALSTKPKDIEG